MAEEYKVVSKVGSITLEYGVTGKELQKELNDATEVFLKAMEARGFILYDDPRMRYANPGWISSTPGNPLPFYGVDWEGKRITLYVTKVKAFGETVDALRVRNKAPQRLPELTPESDNWNEAKQAIQMKAATVQQIRKKYVLTNENEKLLCSE